MSERQISGFVLDASELDDRFVVELLLDGFPTQIARANLYDRQLCDAGLGDGCYGFVFTIAPEAFKAARLVEVRLANTNEPLGIPIQLDDPATQPVLQNGEGRLRWIGGLRFTGWFEQQRRDKKRSVKAFVDGELVAEAEATCWRHVDDRSDAIAAPAFDLHLPSYFADGRVRQLRAIDDAGAEIAGSPCQFVAFEGGLSRFLERCAEIESETLRGELFDRLIPQSLPFASFDEWKRAFPLPAAAQDKKIKIAVVLIGETDLDASIRSLHTQVGCDWIAGAICDDGGQCAFRNEDLAKFLDSDATDCELVVFALSGTRFQAGALNYLANSFAAFPAAMLAYSDVTIPGDHEKEWPIAFPAFDYERMLEQGYGAYFFATRISYAREAAAKGVGDLFRLFNMSVDGPILAGLSSAKAAECQMPVHAPGFLARIPRPDLRDGATRLSRATEAHLKTRGMSAVSSPASGALFPAARVQRKRPGKRVSILIPTRDRVDLLKPCLASLRRTINFADIEVIVLNNDSSSPDALAFFAEIAEAQIRVVNVRGPFNFSRIIGSGVSVASGEYILLLNNDIEALKAGWLEEMLSRIAEPDVGAVGATLLWPSEVVQHGGVVLGVNFAAGHAFSERINGDPGYGDLLVVARQCSAVTAACLLTRRRLFLDLGGFDEDHFPVNFNDVDFCLRLRARGYRIIVTPYAKLMHRESASRGRDTRHDLASRTQGELRNLRSAWGEALLSDPFYNPLLSLDETPFSALAWPPRSVAPRQPLSVQAHEIPPGF